MLIVLSLQPEGGFFNNHGVKEFFSRSLLDRPPGLKDTLDLERKEGLFSVTHRMEVILSSAGPYMFKLFHKEFEQFFFSQLLKSFEKIRERTVLFLYPLELFSIVYDGFYLFAILYHMRVFE